MMRALRLHPSGDGMKKLIFVLAVTLACVGNAFAAKSYSYFRVGSASDVATATTAGTVLMGGGTDVDAAFQWMCQRSGNGDFLVIRATGTDAYNPYIQQLCPNENSVSTLIIPNRTAASDPFVISTIQNAEALWIAGGDQSNYINYWKGTPVQTALQGLIARGVPIGGTSAGMNVLSQFIYSALASQGVTSSQALADPFSRYITLDRDFVSITTVAGLIGDPHFVTRDRMGRDLAFLCRINLNGWSAAPRGISIDEQTALLIDGSGNGTVVGSSTVYFLQAPGAPQVCQSKTPLTYQNIGVYRIAAGGTFNLSSWTGQGGVSYSVSANVGVLSSTQSGGSIY
jgi:cyanophycinase